MNDNEIIKALECCKSENGNDCEGCPCQNVAYKQGSGGCTNALMGYALDLINRQKAEVERLEKGELSKAMTFNSDTIKRCVNEAIKEFAERLKVSMFNYYECVSESAKGRPYKGDTLMDYEIVNMIEDCIDNLLLANGVRVEILNNSVGLVDEHIEERKKARWLINPDGYYPQCTNCWEEPKSREMEKICPNCGAEMEGFLDYE